MTVLLQSATGITKRGSFITKCDRYYKAWQFYYKVRQVLQSVTVLLQSATGITKCDDYYKMRQNKLLKLCNEGLHTINLVTQLRYSNNLCKRKIKLITKNGLKKTPFWAVYIQETNKEKSHLLHLWLENTRYFWNPIRKVDVKYISLIYSTLKKTRN